jgi:hypothetical protein
MRVLGCSVIVLMELTIARHRRSDHASSVVGGEGLEQLGELPASRLPAGGHVL